MNERNILIIEDDLKLAQHMKSFLSEQGFQVSLAHSAQDGFAALEAQNYAAIILDWMLPDQPGVDLCPLIRNRWTTPILMLTARYGDQAEIQGLDAGADDFVVKPIRPELLLARIKALTRRAQTTPPLANPDVSVLTIGPLSVFLLQRTVVVSDQTLTLTNAEYELLKFFASNAGRVLSRDELYLNLRGIPYDGVDRSIDLRISRVRRKIEDICQKPQLIKSVRGVGYMMISI